MTIKKIIISLSMTAIVSFIPTLTTTIVKADTVNQIGVQYQAQVQNIGWQKSVSNGAEAGTDGKSLRVETLKLNLLNAPTGAKIDYQTHVQSIGWQNAVEDGAEAGTVGKSLRVEAIKISLKNLPGYSVQYRVHVQHIGWMDWVSDGQIAGTTGESLRVEAVEIKLVKISDNTTVGVQYQGHVQNVGWQEPVQNGQIAGTEGQSLRVEALKIGLLNAPAGAKINYQTHVQSIGWQTPVSDNAEGGTDGKSLRVEAIKIALENLPGYSVQYRAHVQNIGWQPWVSNGQEAGTDGKSLRIEAIEVRIVKTTDGSTPTPVQFINNVSSISLNKTTDTLTVGNTDNLTATIAPTNAANKSVTWKSSNSSVVAVDNTGKVTAASAGTATITATTADGGKTANCTVTVNNKKGYVYNQELQIDLKVRSAPSLNGSVVGTLYNYQQIDILDTVVDSSGNKWDKFVYKNGTAYIADAYVSDAYIQRYTSPPDNVVNVASNITKTFEVKNSSQVTGNFDGTGLSLGYLQWCIGQDTLQPLLNRMDREHNAEMKSIFGTNYTALHNMILDTPANQLKWAKSINDSSNNIIEPWHTQFTNLCNNQDFKNIESDAQVYTVKQAMLICDKYNLKTVRGFVLAFDIATQNGGITSDASKIIDAAVQKNPNITEKNLLGVIANAVADTSTINKDDVRARELAIVNGKGTVHGSTLNLDANYGLSDTSWR